MRLSAIDFVFNRLGQHLTQDAANVPLENSVKGNFERFTGG